MTFCDSYRNGELCNAVYQSKKHLDEPEFVRHDKALMMQSFDYRDFVEAIIQVTKRN